VPRALFALGAVYLGWRDLAAARIYGSLGYRTEGAGGLVVAAGALVWATDCWPVLSALLMGCGSAILLWGIVWLGQVERHVIVRERRRGGFWHRWIPPVPIARRSRRECLSRQSPPVRSGGALVAAGLWCIIGAVLFAGAGIVFGVSFVVPAVIFFVVGGVALAVGHFG